MGSYFSYQFLNISGEFVFHDTRKTCCGPSFRKLLLNGMSYRLQIWESAVGRTGYKKFLVQIRLLVCKSFHRSIGMKQNPVNTISSELYNLETWNSKRRLLLGWYRNSKFLIWTRQFVHLNVLLRISSFYRDIKSTDLKLDIWITWSLKWSHIKFRGDKSVRSSQNNLLWSRLFKNGSL